MALRYLSDSFCLINSINIPQTQQHTNDDNNNKFGFLQQTHIPPSADVVGYDNNSKHSPASSSSNAVTSSCLMPPNDPMGNRDWASDWSERVQATVGSELRYSPESGLDPLNPRQLFSESMLTTTRAAVTGTQPAPTAPPPDLQHDNKTETTEQTTAEQTKQAGRHDAVADEITFVDALDVLNEEPLLVPPEERPAMGIEEAPTAPGNIELFQRKKLPPSTQTTTDQLYVSVIRSGLMGATTCLLDFEEAAGTTAYNTCGGPKVQDKNTQTSKDDVATPKAPPEPYIKAKQPKPPSPHNTSTVITQPPTISSIDQHDQLDIQPPTVKSTATTTTDVMSSTNNKSHPSSAVLSANQPLLPSTYSSSAHPRPVICHLHARGGVHSRGCHQPQQQTTRQQLTTTCPVQFVGSAEHKQQHDNNRVSHKSAVGAVASSSCVGPSEKTAALSGGGCESESYTDWLISAKSLLKGKYQDDPLKGTLGFCRGGRRHWGVFDRRVSTEATRQFRRSNEYECLPEEGELPTFRATYKAPKAVRGKSGGAISAGDMRLKMEL
eukprot:GHVS01048492.1.p1 GENE.GHVS01048492.1~~GHVS01048492.1.p1  ORF type:complete len:551 (+),score=133.01 GHVS01048492.1:139-1791(+)